MDPQIKLLRQLQEYDLEIYEINQTTERLRETLDELIAACDDDGNGEVNYKEFVDALARDTVAPAAMGKRDMQAKEAMGQDDVEVLSEHIKRRPKKNERFSLNAEVL